MILYLYLYIKNMAHTKTKATAKLMTIASKQVFNLKLKHRSLVDKP